MFLRKFYCQGTYYRCIHTLVAFHRLPPNSYSFTSIFLIFQDIHYLASDVGNFGLAEVAKQKALQIHNEPLTSGIKLIA